MPSVALNLDLGGLESFLRDLESLDRTVEAGLMATGDAAAYAEVWEWGNARQQKQGPKTVLGINPDGETVWLSTQAPLGYIAVHTDKYLDIVKAELGGMPLNGAGERNQLKQVAHDAMEKIKEVVAEHAPVDTGQLRDSFRVLDDGDPELNGDPGGSIESRFRRVLNIR